MTVQCHPLVVAVVAAAVVVVTTVSSSSSNSSSISSSSSRSSTSSSTTTSSSSSISRISSRSRIRSKMSSLPLSIEFSKSILVFDIDSITLFPIRCMLYIMDQYLRPMFLF